MIDAPPRQIKKNLQRKNFKGFKSAHTSPRPTETSWRRHILATSAIKILRTKTSETDIEKTYVFPVSQ